MNDLKELPPELHEFRADTTKPREAWLMRTRNRLLVEENSRFSAWRLSRTQWNAVRIIGATAAAGVIGAVTVGLLPINGDHNSHFGNETAAAAVLREAAGNASKVAGRTQVELAGKYVYTRSHSEDLNTVTVPLAGSDVKELTFREETITEIWSPADGKGRTKVRDTMMKREAISPVEELKKAGVDLNAKNVVTEDAWNDSEDTTSADLDGLTPDQLAKLPTDPDKLLEVIKKAPPSEGASSPAEQQLATVERFMSQGDAVISPELRKAFFLAAAKIEGVRNIEQVKLDGRNGVAIGVANDGDLNEIVIDPKTSRVLGHRYITDYKDGKGTIWNSDSSYSAVVDKPGDVK